MTTASRYAFLVLAFLASGPPSSSAAESGPPPIHRWIEGLGDPSWEVREESQAALIRLGAEAIAPLLRARSSVDPEISLRAKTILALVDPLRIQVRLQRIDLGDPPAVAETLEGDVADDGEIELPGRPNPADRSSTFAVQCRPIGEDRVNVIVSESAGSSLRTALHPGPVKEGEIGIVKRGEESTYRQIGLHIERTRRPFAVILRWWPTRASMGPDRVAPSPADLPALIRDLVAQAGSAAPASRLAALELLGRLGAKEGEAAFATAEKAREFRAPALIGLVRLGRAGALQELEETVAESAPDGDAAGGPPRPSPAPGPLEALGSGRRPPVYDGQVPEVFWRHRILIALAEAGSGKGLEGIARNLGEADPSALHGLLAMVADRFRGAPAEARRASLDALSSPDFLAHLGWEDPEVEHLFSVLLEDPALAGDGTFAPKLLSGLARSLGAETWYGSGRPRILARLLELTGSGEEGRQVRQGVLDEVLDAPAGASRAAEIVAWMKLSYRDRPMEDGDFEKLIRLIRSSLLRGEQLQRTGPSGLLDLAPAMILTEGQLASFVRLLAEAAAIPGQPYAPQFLREVDRLTGLQVSRRLPGQPQRPEGETGPLAQVARWSVQAEEIAKAHRKLYAPSGGTGGEELELWDFHLAIADRGAPSPTGGSPVQILDGRRLALRSGEPVRVSDCWGNREVLRIDNDPAISPPRYRLNGQTYLEIGLPSFVVLREKEVRLGRYETSDVRLGPMMLSARKGARLGRLCWLRRRAPGAAGVEPSPRDLWATFTTEFTAALDGSGRLWERALPLIRDLDLREAIPFLLAELQKGASSGAIRADFQQAVGRLLFEMGEPAGAEHLRKELGAGDARRRQQAAQALAAAGDREGFRVLLALLRERPPGLNPYGALSALDAFLKGGSPSPEEVRDILDLVAELLPEPTFMSMGFAIFSGQSGNDFGFSESFSIPVPAEQKKAQLRAVESARSWWAERRGASHR